MIVARSQTGPSGRLSAKRINGPANQTAAAKPASAIALTIRSSQRVIEVSGWEVSGWPGSQCLLPGDHHVDTAIAGAAFRGRIVGDRFVFSLAIDGYSRRIAELRRHHCFDSLRPGDGK